WIPLRGDYMRALLRLDGRPGAVVRREIRGCACRTCPNPRSPARLYRCTSGCRSCTWWCKHCILEAHADRPLDRVEMWVYGQWQATTLKQIGQVVQFGHWDGSRCSLTRRHNEGFIVIDSNGIHEISVKFCGCTAVKFPVREQLLAARMWPATTDNPKTAATFQVLDAFNAHSGSGKDNAYDFYNALESLTDGAGLLNLPPRSKEFFRMAHEYRHIEMAKRGGRGHDPRGGVEKTARGELAVLCPACAHKGINTDVVDDLRKISPELADAAGMFNDTIQLSTDANFRAKNRNNKSTTKTSPYLGDGMAYMVPDGPYEAYTRNNVYQEEMSNCSRFGALVLANLKAGKHMRTTGIGAVFCSRHEFFWPNAIGTLVKGERYCTMDFIIASALRRVHVGSLQLYYDIICQFTRNLNARMLSVPPRSFIHVGAQKLIHELHVTFGVPKFHNPAHQVLCQLWFNISYMVGAGNTDGEASERAWAGLNPAASSLREMGPGTMRDTVDFYCGCWNWRKFINIGTFLENKMELAINEARDHCEIYTGIRQVIHAESPEMAETWVGEAVTWEEREMLDELGRPIVKGPNAVTNPYESRTQSKLKCCSKLWRLAIAVRPLTEPLRWRATRAQKGRTVLQETERLEQRTELHRQMRQFRKEQQWLMPLGRVNAKGPGSKKKEAKVPGGELCLPSELNRDVARTSPMLDLIFEELKLRWAGMGDWLDILRQQLRVRGTVDKWKTDYVRGQNLSTRARDKQEAIQANIDMAKEMYRLHRERYITLLGFLDEKEVSALVPGAWEKTFQVLQDSDCKPLTHRLILNVDDAEIEHIKLVMGGGGGAVTGQGSHRIPWIWYRINTGSKLELNDDLRVEFVKCRARAMRWVEEVYKLSYEMMRVPAFCRSRARWWAAREEVMLDGADEELADGVRAYAVKQGTMFTRQANGMAGRFKKSLEQAAKFVRWHGLDGLQKIPEQQ
ncbi:hypothetical protein PENSPDRAFT_593936, partial [Peniophora sp. CONT]